MHEWVWDSTVASVSTRLSMNDREVQFHPTYSNGTAAIRGNMPCVNNNDYYWEIKILSPVYGTDVVSIGLPYWKIILIKGKQGKVNC